jgi:L-fuconolactonase
MGLVVDAHHHFWDRSMAGYDHSWLEDNGHEKICRNFLPEHLEPLIREAGIDRTVFVQTQHHIEETHWVLSLAEQHEWLAGVVGWVDLASPACEAQIEAFKDHPKFVGVRHLVQGEPDDFIIRDDVLAGLAVLEKHDVAYDLLFFVPQLQHAATVARRFPNLRLVIDHLAKPYIKNGVIDGWKEDFVAAASCPNVHCKLSGMVTEADWQNWAVEDLKPYVDIALEHFTPQRCMFGSDWPVCELAASYQDVFDALTDCIGGVSVHERERILGQNAIDFYRLEI